MRPLGTWANEIHFATEDVPKLRYFIDAQLANDLADARSAVVIFAGPHRSCSFRVHSHGTKLHNLESSPVFSNAFLLVENWTRRFELDYQGSHQRDGER